MRLYGLKVPESCREEEACIDVQLFERIPFALPFFETKQVTKSGYQKTSFKENPIRNDAKA